MKRLERTALELRKQAMEDLYFFTTDILGYEDLDPDFHREVCKWFQDWPGGKYRLTLLPRGHFKTTIGSVAHTIWEWLWDPMLSVLCVHYKLEQSCAILQEIKNHLETNERLRFIAPDITFANHGKEAKLWLSDRININRPKYKRVPSFVAASQDATVTGLHFDRFKIDDLVTEETIATDNLRQKSVEWFKRSVALQRDPSKSRYDIIGTHWHPDDLYSYLRQPENGYSNGPLKFYARGCFGNGPDGRAYTGIEPEAKPIFKTRFRMQDLLDIKAQQGDFNFSCMYLNDPVSSDVVTFQAEQVQFFDLEQFKSNLAVGKNEEAFTFFTLVDPNRKREAHHDPGVVMTVARSETNHYYVVDIRYERFTVDDLVSEIREQVLRWKPEFVGVETVAGQIFLMDPIRASMTKQHWETPMKEINRGANQGKGMRILRCQPVIDGGRLHLPAQDGKRHPLFTEIRVYGTVGKTHDHALDCLSDAIQYGWNPRPKPKRETKAGKYTWGEIARRVKQEQKKVSPRW